MELLDQTQDQRVAKQIVIIPQEMGIPSVIAGYILEKTGKITPDMEVVVRSNRRLSTQLKNDAVNLFKADTLNPTYLFQAIDQSNLTLNRHTIAHLKWLAFHTQYYRSFPIEKWWQVGEKVTNWNLSNKNLHNYLSTFLWLYRDDPNQSFAKSKQALERTSTHPEIFFNNKLQANLSVPFLKNSDNGPDVIQYGDVVFDRTRIILLVNEHFSFVVGGSPHSGKSTFAASLRDSLTQVVEDCQKDGIIAQEDISVTGCELDLGTPTLQFIGDQEALKARQKKVWDITLANQAVRNLKEAQANHTITIGDLPGGTPPDEVITSRIAREGSFSIKVDKYFGDQDQWREYLYGFDIPPPIILVHTRKDETDRGSGVRIYTSRQNGAKEDQLRGRVVNLDLQSNPSDPFITLAAHAILFNFLPETVISKMRYANNILRSLQYA